MTRRLHEIARPPQGFGPTGLDHDETPAKFPCRTGKCREKNRIAAASVSDNTLEIRDLHITFGRFADGWQGNFDNSLTPKSGARIGDPAAQFASCHTGILFYFHN
jgi:hypothetical protein